MVYRLTGNEKFSRDFGLRDQARRAAVSLANIAEGFFITRLCPHRNSIVISILLKTKVMSQNQFYEEARRVKTMMFRFIDSLRTHDET